MELSDNLNKSKAVIARESEELSLQRRKLEQSLARDVEEVKYQQQKIEHDQALLKQQQLEFDQEKNSQISKLNQREDDLKKKE